MPGSRVGVPPLLSTGQSLTSGWLSSFSAPILKDNALRQTSSERQMSRTDLSIHIRGTHCEEATDAGPPCET